MDAASHDASILKKLRQEEAVQLDSALEGYNYISGAALFPAEHPLLERFVGETTDCAADVSPHLFSYNLAFPNCSYCCGSTEDLVDEKELRGRYQRVHQVCGAC